MNEPKVAIEVAEAEILRFMDAMDLDADPQGLNEEEERDFAHNKRRLVRAIQDGSLVINEDGEPVYTPKEGDREPITFREPHGSAYMATDKRKKNEGMAKTFALMGDYTGQAPKRFALMKNRDLKVCLAITQLFLA